MRTQPMRTSWLAVISCTPGHAMCSGQTEMVHQKGWQLDPETGHKFDTSF